MTPNEELIKKVDELSEKVEDLEQEKEALMHLPEAVSKLNGVVDTLTTLVTGRFEPAAERLEKAGNLKTAIQFAAVVLVPIIVSLIGGYFVLKAGGSK